VVKVALVEDSFNKKIFAIAPTNPHGLLLTYPCFPLRQRELSKVLENMAIELRIEEKNVQAPVLKRECATQNCPFSN